LPRAGAEANRRQRDGGAIMIYAIFGEHAFEVMAYGSFISILLLTATLIISIARRLYFASLPTKSRDNKVLWLFTVLLIITYAELASLGIRDSLNFLMAYFYLWYLAFALPLITCQNIAQKTGKLEMPLMYYCIIIFMIGLPVVAVALVWPVFKYEVLLYELLCFFASIVAVGQHNARVKAINSAQNLP
jgi:hypothetical protein